MRSVFGYWLGFPLLILAAVDAILYFTLPPENTTMLPLMIFVHGIPLA